MAENVLFKCTTYILVYAFPFTCCFKFGGNSEWTASATVVTSATFCFSFLTSSSKLAILGCSSLDAPVKWHCYTLSMYILVKYGTRGALRYTYTNQGACSLWCRLEGVKHPGTEWSKASERTDWSAFRGYSNRFINVLVLRSSCMHHSYMAICLSWQWLRLCCVISGLPQQTFSTGQQWMCCTS